MMDTWIISKNLQDGLPIQALTLEMNFGYTHLGLDGIWETDDGEIIIIMPAMLQSPKYENMALAIGLSFVNHEEKVADGTHDVYIIQLADFYFQESARFF